MRNKEQWKESIGETFENLGIDEDDVDESTLGFAEMMSIKLGEMVDVPRNQRVQALKA